MQLPKHGTRKAVAFYFVFFFFWGHSFFFYVVFVFVCVVGVGRWGGKSLSLIQSLNNLILFFYPNMEFGLWIIYK